MCMSWIMTDRHEPWIALDQVTAGAEAGAKPPQAAEYPSSRVATTHGRPKWDRVFASIAAAHPRQRVGVFVCGPKVQPRPQNPSSYPNLAFKQIGTLTLAPVSGSPSSFAAQGAPPRLPDANPTPNPRPIP